MLAWSKSNALDRKEQQYVCRNNVGWQFVDRWIDQFRYFRTSGNAKPAGLNDYQSEPPRDDSKFATCGEIRRDAQCGK